MNSEVWEILLSGLPALILQIIYQELKDNKEKKQLIQSLEDAKNIIEGTCNKLRTNNLSKLPVLPDSKSLIDLIKFYQETPFNWQEQLKKVQQAKERAEVKNSFLMMKLRHTEEKLIKETTKRINVENKLTEFEEKKQNELSWKKFGEDLLIEYQAEQWTSEQLKDEKTQELLDSIDYKVWETHY